ncbi:Sterol-binding domain protein [Methylotuvimicrobium alcaliphilum 20Z]|uniref:Ubiquinone biosynthesis accessory factor UbiJ n=2 Tax=Methylotuvimicrobium alcaliphilum TaxID=271065 RepID=G4SVX0_META2|nr:Sterol-binding domain protein [Methylotuvimicrobium alcaliphilum 20Z]
MPPQFTDDSLMTVKPLLLSVFEAALNRFVALDRDASYLLAPLTGKVIGITLRPFNETLYLCPSETAIQVLDDYPAPADTLLTGTALAFGAKGLGSTLFNDSIEISGDNEVGNAFINLFEKIDIDLEEILSRYTGDIIAHRIGRFFRTGQSWTGDILESFRLNLTEFLQEEARDLPAKPETDIFYRKISDLQTDLDRLQSRLENLEITHTEQP